ncbi:MAG: T9SS type A sorting domain-containing protein [Saprospiraceae bacterium]|nr:T9SS type A sorting domain-containing protein [Saprospiraceae bacterium]
MQLDFRFLHLLPLLLFAYHPNAQVLENHFYGNTVGADLWPGHLIATSDGGAVITGKTNTLDTGGYHVLLICTDSLGNVLWQRTYHQGAGTWVCKSLDGGFVVGGSSDRHIFGSQQGFILKVNASGVEEWIKYIPMGDHAYVSHLVQLSSSDIAVCGVVIDEGQDASQKVFWSIFDADGDLKKYETIDDVENSYAPKIVEAKNGNLILAWPSFGPDWIRCITTNGQTVWEHNLTEAFDYQYDSDKSLLVDSIGDLWLAGGFKIPYNAYAFIPQVLHFSSSGNLIQRIAHDYWNSSNAISLFPSQNGTINLWFAKYFGNSGGGYVKLKLSSQGAVLKKDSIIFSTFQRVKAIAEVNENRLLLLNATPFEKHNIRVQPIQKSAAAYQASDPWLFSSGLPYSHDLYEAHCKSLSGGEFVLTRGESKTGELLHLGYYVLRINENDQELDRNYLGDGTSSQVGQIQPTTDGGAVALGSKGIAWKVDADANLIWSKQAKNGKLFSGTDNDFFIAESKSQPGIYDPIRIYHFNSAGDSVSVTNVYSRSQPYYLAGGVSQIGNGPMLFANKFNESDTSWHNWLIYLDKEGKFVSEVLLSNEYERSSFTNKSIHTSDGGTLIASHHYSTQCIYMMHVKDGEVLWSTNVFALGSDPDSIYLNLISIEEVPCRGYLVAFESGSNYTNTPSKKFMVLYYIDENGIGKNGFAYNPLPGFVHPDTNFLPGYTFRRWGYQLNGQTYDILLQTVHFQDSSNVEIPIGHLAIMPNPSGDEICLQYESDTYGLMDISVFNAAGQRMDHFISEKTTSVWQFHHRSNYPAGIYLIQIRNGKKEPVIGRWLKVR